ENRAHLLDVSIFKSSHLITINRAYRSCGNIPMTTRIHMGCYVLVFVAFGCAHTPRVAGSPPPLPDVKAVQEDTFSGHDLIVANGVDEYIATYHDAGWLRALGDVRDIGASNTSADRSTSIEKSQSVLYYELAVKAVI